MKLMNLVRANATVNTIADNKAFLAQTVMNNTYEICGKKIASVPVSLMELDYEYQRVLGATVKKLMAEFDMNKCDFLIASFRNNKFYIIDGQHRYSVAKAKGIEALPCIIFTGLTQSEEALKFAQQQDNVNKLKPYDTFKANIACGDTSIHDVFVDMEIKRICDKHNVEIKKYGGRLNSLDKSFKCLGTARVIVNKQDGVKRFELIMDIINTTHWGETSLSYCDKIISALNSFIGDNKDQMDIIQPKLIEVMNEKSPDELIAYGNYMFPDYPSRASVALALNDLVMKKFTSNCPLVKNSRTA